MCFLFEFLFPLLFFVDTGHFNPFELFNSFRNYVKQGDPAMLEGCDIECKQDLLCSMVTSNFGDQTKCNEISRKMTLDDWAWVPFNHA